MLNNNGMVLVTGGGGYLGSVLVPMLLNQGYEVKVIDRFFFGKNKIAKHFKDNCQLIEADTRWYPKKILNNVRYVLDLASLSNDPIGDLNPQRTLDINYQARARTARLAKEMGIEKYVLASTCSVYGYHNNILDEKSKLNPLTVYAKASSLAEKSVLKLNDRNFTVTVLRQGTLFGLSERMRFDILVNTIVLSIYKDRMVNIKGGEQWRPIVHVRDSARAFTNVLDADKSLVSGEIFNVGSTKQNYQIGNLAVRIAKRLGPDISINIDTAEKDFRSYKVSCEKIKNKLGFQTKESPYQAAKEIYESLENKYVTPSKKTKTIEWYKELLKKDKNILDQKFIFTNFINKSNQQIVKKTLKVKKIKKCLICGSPKISLYLSLGVSALANSFLLRSKLRALEVKVPLDLYYCKNCYLVQLGHLVDRKMIFQDYAYFSSTSPQLLKHFQDYADEVYKRFPAQAKRFTLEIASNDGILLKPFLKKGCKVLGVDPAKNVAKIANENGIETIADFFNLKLSKKLLKKFGKAGIISANNVLAHTDIPHEIISGVKEMLAEDGVFVFEAQYFGDLFQKNEFDNTYHEHIFYYSLHPLKILLERHGLEIFNVEHVATQGGSLRVYTSHSPSIFKIDKSVANYLKKEKDMGLYKFATYKEFSKRPPQVKEKLNSMLLDLKSQGKKIAGYGAPAKGNTLLQYCGVGSSILDYITDEAPSKIGKFTPGTHIPVVSPKKLKEETPDYILILAWNYSDDIINKREGWFTKHGGKFIIPVPEPYIV